MSMMIAEIYEALVEAGTSEEKAKAAAAVVPVMDNLEKNRTPINQSALVDNQITYKHTE